MTGWSAFRVCLIFSFEIRLACTKTALAAAPCSKERWQGNVLLSCIAALKQKRVNLETAITSQIAEGIFRPFPCCCDEIFAFFFTSKLLEWQFWTFFFAGHITAIFHSLWDPDPASGRCLHRWVVAWNNTWLASTGPAQSVLTMSGGGHQGSHWCALPLSSEGRSPPCPWQACLSNAATGADIQAARVSAGRSSRLHSFQTFLGQPGQIQTP